VGLINHGIRRDLSAGRSRSCIHRCCRSPIRWSEHDRRELAAVADWNAAGQGRGSRHPAGVGPAYAIVVGEGSAGPRRQVMGGRPLDPDHTCPWPCPTSWRWAGYLGRPTRRCRPGKGTVRGRGRRAPERSWRRSGAYPGFPALTGLCRRICGRPRGTRSAVPIFVEVL
jgi:hypothetical protein